tara:strand:- start:1008 stop:2321 length:1314 start_codon:yes stop_codon:yes gene_type:complete
MAINDILSVYRQSLVSERQARVAEAQMALQAMQFETQQGFRESGRQREDVIMALNEAKGGAQESITSDASSIAMRFSTIPEIANAKQEIVEGTNQYKDPDKIVENLKESYKFTDSEASNILNVVNYYNLASSNPKFAGEAQKAAVNIGIQIAGQYDAWEREGADPEVLKDLDFLKALNKSGVIDLDSIDPLMRQQSSDIFLGVAQGTQMLENISSEFTEFAKQDYEVQRPITIGDFDTSQQDVQSVDFMDLATALGASIGLGPEDVPTTTTAKVDLPSINDDSSQKIISSLDFLEKKDLDRITKEIETLSSTISSKEKTLQTKTSKRDTLISELDNVKSDKRELLKKVKYYDKIDDKKSMKSTMKEIKKLNNIINTSKASKERKAINLMDTNPNALTMGGYYPDTITKEIADLSSEINSLKRKKVNYGYDLDMTDID